jgi:hypothetical protein
MADSLLLNPETWDLLIDSEGDIALVSDPYSLAQDVASAIKTFLSECWYDTSLGVPYFEEILGQFPPMSLVKKRIEEAALSVTGVISAKCIITEFTKRNLSGYVQFIDATGQINNVNF